MTRHWTEPQFSGTLANTPLTDTLFLPILSLIRLIPRMSYLTSG